MKKSMSTTRRLLAFLLAFALVLGYVPALDVVAESTVAYAKGTQPAVTLNRAVADYTYTVNAGDGYTIESVTWKYGESEVTDNETPYSITGNYTGLTAEVTLQLNTGDPTGSNTIVVTTDTEDAKTYGVTIKRQEANYTYTVVPAEKYSITSVAWKNGETVETDDEQVNTPNAITVAYDSLTAKVTLDDVYVIEVTFDGDAPVTAYWTAIADSTAANYYVGVPFVNPESTHGEVAQGATVAHTYTYSGENVHNVVGAPYATAEGNVTITETVSVDNVDLYTVTYQVNVGTAEIGAELTASGPYNETTGWYTGDVTVTANVTTQPGLVDSSYLQKLYTVEEGVQTEALGEWKTNEAKSVWTKNVTLSSSNTVSYGTQSKIYQIDTVKPKVVNYRTDSVHGVPYIKVEYKVGESGLKSIKVNDKEYSGKELITG